MRDREVAVEDSKKWASRLSYVRRVVTNKLSPFSVVRDGPKIFVFACRFASDTLRYAITRTLDRTGL